MLFLKKHQPAERSYYELPLHLTNGRNKTLFFDPKKEKTTRAYRFIHTRTKLNAFWFSVFFSRRGRCFIFFFKQKQRPGDRSESQVRTVCWLVLLWRDGGVVPLYYKHGDFFARMEIWAYVWVNVCKLWSVNFSCTLRMYEQSCWLMGKGAKSLVKEGQWGKRVVCEIQLI